MMNNPDDARAGRFLDANVFLNSDDDNLWHTFDTTVRFGGGFEVPAYMIQVKKD